MFGIPLRFATGIVSNPDASGLDRSTYVSSSLCSLSTSVTTTYDLMSLYFSKRSVRKILERIIPPPSGGRDELHFVRSHLNYPTPLRFGDSSLWDPIRDPQAHYIFSGALTPNIFNAFCKTILISLIRKSLAAVN